MSQGGSIMSGDSDWQRDILKTQNIELIYKKCKEKLIELLRVTGESMSESQLDDEATEFLEKEYSTFETMCNCGGRCSCVFPTDKPINDIVTWFYTVKKTLPEYEPPVRSGYEWRVRQISFIRRPDGFHQYIMD